MHELFDICVEVLYWIADITGLTYKEANIWIFVIIHPIVTVALFAIVIWQRNKINRKVKTDDKQRKKRTRKI
jgi:hypothetical protein